MEADSFTKSRTTAPSFLSLWGGGFHTLPTTIPTVSILPSPSSRVLPQRWNRDVAPGLGQGQGGQLTSAGTHSCFPLSCWLKRWHSGCYLACREETNKVAWRAPEAYMLILAGVWAPLPHPLPVLVILSRSEPLPEQPHLKGPISFPGFKLAFYSPRTLLLELSNFIVNWRLSKANNSSPWILMLLTHYYW